MLKKLFYKNRWKRGAGEFVSFAIAGVMLVMLFTQFIAVNILNMSCKNIERTAQEACRVAIACKSLDDAQEKAEAYVYSRLDSDPHIYDVEVLVEYTPGFPSKWKKGNYLTVTLIGYVETTSPLISGTHEAMSTMMIEHLEDLTKNSDQGGGIAG